MKKTVSAILLLSKNQVYGQRGSLLWSVPEHVTHFHKLTLGSSVIMGHLTWLTLPIEDRPLPRRENIVLSRNQELVLEDAKVAHSFDEAIAMASCSRIFGIGGLAVWRKTMDIAHEIWITVVKKEYPIIKEVTLTAPDFLHLTDRWPDFQLIENQKYRSLGSEGLEFEVQQWIK